MSELALLGGDAVAEDVALPSWPQIGEAEKAAVADALEASDEDSSYLTSYDGGPATEGFEEAFADLTGTEYALATNGGGTALHLAMIGAGVEAGDEVIVSGYSWGQTAACILQQNAVPMYADIDPETYTLTAESIAERITPQTEAIVVVHIYGHPADMDPIVDLADEHDLTVVEDCAQATGATYDGRRVGGLGDIGCFSVGDGKQIVGGEGGVLVTDDRDIFERACLYGMHPVRNDDLIADEGRQHYVDSLIYTYRIHPFAAVIATEQLDKLDRLNAERRANCDHLSDGLADVPGIEPPTVRDDCEHVYHGYSPTFVPDAVPVSREVFVEAVSAEGVPITEGYVGTPIHLRPAHQDHEYHFGHGLPWSGEHAARDVTYDTGDCPVTEERCGETELFMWVGQAAIGEQTDVFDAYLRAFEKVTDNLDALREYEPEE
jgi:dTDP-4-amino-4,6-dideoxygalactose transaminase